MARGTFCVVGGGGPMVIDSEDAGATVIAVVARRLLISPCPGIAMGVRTMVVVTVQGAPDFANTGLGQADRPDQRPGFARAGSEKFRFGTEPWQLQ
jgi:hypothetical protein